MAAPLRSGFESRQQSVRTALDDASLDVLVVTHLPNVRYLCGFTGTAGVLVVDPKSCTLLIDFRYVTAARALAESFGSAAALDLEIVDGSYDDALVRLLRTRGWRRIGIEAAHMSVSRFNHVATALAAGEPQDSIDDSIPELVPTERIVERARSVKDASEIALMREAARRLSDVARAVPPLIRTGRTEQEVAAAIDAALRGAGFERPAFETIVASGPNSALPHARPTARTLRDGDGVVLDFGGVYDGYCVDLTRTVQLGRRSDDLARIFTAVQRAQAAALAAVHPGVNASDIDAAAREVLREAGLGDAFGHGTGHGLGLEVHEEPRIARLTPGQPDTPIVAGMVFTIEPGAYVAGVGGVRIEDDVLVVANGCDLLTDVPIDL